MTQCERIYKESIKTRRNSKAVSATSDTQWHCNRTNSSWRGNYTHI